MMTMTVLMMMMMMIMIMKVKRSMASDSAPNHWGTAAPAAAVAAPRLRVCRTPGCALRFEDNGHKHCCRQCRLTGTGHSRRCQRVQQSFLPAGLGHTICRAPGCKRQTNPGYHHWLLSLCWLRRDHAYQTLPWGSYGLPAADNTGHHANGGRACLLDTYYYRSGSVYSTPSPRWACSTWTRPRSSVKALGMWVPSRTTA